MNKLNAAKIFKDIRKAVSKHSPEILTGIGIAGMITTTVLAVKATPKAIMLIEDARYKNGGTLTAPEKVKATWKCYIPAAATGVFSIACLIGAQSVSARRTAALATAYKLSETALTEYKEKVIETVGEKVDKEVKDKIAKDKVEKQPVDSSNVIVTGNGKTLCFDGVFGQYFESDIEHIKKAVNELNYQMLRDEYASLNDFYDMLGIDHIDVGDQVGWNIGKTRMVDIDFSSQIAKDGRPCIVVNYSVAPQYDYYKLM